jgi:dTDP-4-dehydrorhamnose 3,5-epimerase
MDDTEVFYQVGEFYAPEHERGFRWDDAAFAIEWPITPPLALSEKDKHWPDYSL